MIAQTREQKLEQALKAALRMRRAMKDIGPELQVLLAPRILVEEFDRLMTTLTDKKEKR